MADPLSLAASVIAVATVAAQTSKAIAKLRVLNELPSRLQALKNEVTDLEVVLHHIHSLIEERTTMPGADQASLAHLLERARVKLSELSTVIDRIGKSCVGRGKLVNRAASWWKEKPRIQILQDDIRVVKGDLNILLGASNSRDMMRVQLDLQKVSIVTTEASEKSAAFHGHISQEIVEQQSVLARNLEQSRARVDDRLDRLEQLVLQQKSMMESYPHPPLISEFSENLRQRRKQLYRPALMASASESTMRSSQQVSSIRVQAFQYKSAVCRSGCPCACHLKREVQSPGVVGRIIGQLFLGYAGLPLTSQKCDLDTCQRQQAPYVSMEYWFPIWFLAQIMRLQLSYRPTLGPQIQLTTLRRVPDSAPCLAFAIGGNIEGLKMLFAQGLASPYDVSETRGLSVLGWALYNWQYETCKFLVAAGADPDYNSTADRVWDFVMRGHLSEHEQETMGCLLSRSDWVEEQEFSLAHKIVLGLSLLSLEEELLIDPSAIHQRDPQGRTALHWAAARGDEVSTAILLSYGADPNAIDKNGMTPVYLAANESRTVCVRLLLEQGADPDPASWRSTPLICAAINSTDLLAIKTLLDFNADIEGCGPEGLTALHQVARAGKADRVILLLESNANLNALSKDGKTPLTMAIMYNNHDVLQTLLDRWYQFTVCPRLRGPNLLQIVAEFADVRTIEILASASHLKISHDKGYALGAMASEKLRQRPDRDEKLAAAFDKLLGIIQEEREQERSNDRLLESGLITDWNRLELTGARDDHCDSPGSPQDYEDAEESLSLAP